jgi:redox-sensitive bicupin YhaK (pirin superfamily)
VEKQRAIREVLNGKPVIEGAGVHLKRAMGFSEKPLFDPFLLLDDFRSHNPDHYLKGFPWHPHRGIETITYVLCGDVAHGDSLGNSGHITSGDVQWMTAGSGIIHQEMPKGNADGKMEGIQLWANLPAAQKMMEPRYRDVKAAQIPQVQLENGTTIKVISGRVGDTVGPVQGIVIEPQYLDVSMPAHSELRHPTKTGHTVFAYVIEGHGRFNNEHRSHHGGGTGGAAAAMAGNAWLGNGRLALFGNGDHIWAGTADETFRFLLISGKPIGEPIAWQGPIVMNTQEELEIAFEEFRQGHFVK